MVELHRVDGYRKQLSQSPAAHLDQQTGLTLSWLPEINSEGLHGA